MERCSVSALRHLQVLIGTSEVRGRGFSLIEAMVGVTILAIIATVGIQVTSLVSVKSFEAKLRADTQSLNRAVTMYLSSGGDLSSAATGAQVLAKLKTTVSAAQAKTQINPLNRSMVDPRLTVVLQTASEAASSRLRAYWSASNQQFEIATSGAAGGVKAFELSDAAVPTTPQVETRRSGSMEFASNSGWIWDDNSNWDPAADPRMIPTSVPLTAVASLPSAPPAVVPPPPPPLPPTLLSPPAFSLPPGNYPIADFDLSVTITDPNSMGTSALEYSIDSGAWIAYTSALTLAPGSDLQARALSTSAVFQDSHAISGTYDADTVTLQPPELTLSAPAFKVGVVETVMASLNNPNDSSVSRVEFRIDGGDWTAYSSSLPLARSGFPSGASIDAKVVPTAAYYAESSPVTDAVAAAPPLPQFPTNAVLSQDSSTRLYSVQVDPSQSQASFATIAPAGSIQYNAIGYRSADNMLYGINPSSGQLIRVDPSNGNTTVTASLGLVSSYAGDFNTDNGLYYVKTQYESRFYVIDVGSGTIVQQVVITPSVGSIGDIAYNSADGKFYSYDDSKRLYAIDPTTGVATAYPAHAANPSGHAGAAFAHNGSVFIAINSGGLYWMDLSDGSAHWIASSPSSSRNDGAIIAP